MPSQSLALGVGMLRCLCRHVVCWQLHYRGGGNAMAVLLILSVSFFSVPLAWGCSQFLLLLCFQPEVLSSCGSVVRLPDAWSWLALLGPVDTLPGHFSRRVPLYGPVDMLPGR